MLEYERYVLHENTQIFLYSQNEGKKLFNIK